MKKKPAPFRLLAEADASVATLKEDPGNVNVHDERNLEALRRSMERFGQPERLIVRKRDARVFNGNGRLEAMRRMGWKTARVQYVDGGDAECAAYAIAANRTGRLSRFDDDGLADALKSLDKEDPALRAAAGYNEDELKRLLTDLEREPAAKPEDFDRGEARTHATCPKCGHNFAVGGTP